MRFAVIGAGSLGGYLGAKLTRSGHDVAFVARGAMLATLRRSGLRVIGREDVTLPAPVHAVGDSRDIGPVDAVIVAVKSHHLDDVLDQIPPLLGPETAVVTIQNGVRAPYVVSDAVGRERVLPAVLRVFVQADGSGVIVHRGGPGTISLAEPDGRPSPRVAALTDAFVQAGLGVRNPDDVWVDLWEKALYVGPLGALGALADAPAGVVRTRLREPLEGLVEEGAAVGRAQGVALGADVVERVMAFTDAMPAGSTTSMQRDLADGIPSELEGQIGDLVRLGERSGVPTPRLSLVLEVLRVREEQARED